ncbi:MAG TPA: hypothetical protein VGL72_00040 [Bryobacteraceae bacterium]|jgi:hypothetical protein
MRNLYCIRIEVAFSLLLASGAVSAPQAKRNYHFDGEISREVLEHYLSRSITMTEIYRSPGNLDDDIRMLKNIGAKFAGRSIYLWGGEARIADPDFLAKGREMARRIHQNDPDVVLQAAVFEIVTEEVNQVPIPDWVLKEFGQAPEKRNFDYSKMLFPDGTFVNHWHNNSSVPDIRQPETRMWFFFLAGSYMDIGIEAIHFGQLDLMGRKDAGYACWAEFLHRVRAYALKKARRHYLICDAHVPKGGPVVDGKLLLDFHSFPLRPKEVADSPGKAVLAAGYSDGLYGRSNGGIAPSLLEMRPSPLPRRIRQLRRHSHARTGFAGGEAFDFRLGLRRDHLVCAAARNLSQRMAALRLDVAQGTRQERLPGDARRPHADQRPRDRRREVAMVLRQYPQRRLPPGRQPGRDH